jgi:hypothetical protein
MPICKALLLSLATVLLAASANAVSTAADDLVVSVRILDEGKVDRLHVDQAVKVSKDGMVAFFSGGEVRGSEDAPPIEFGTRITGKLTDSVGETKVLTLKVEFSNRFDSGEAKTPVVRGEMVAFKADVKPGESTRISIGRNRWCELRLEQ